MLAIVEHKDATPEQRLIHEGYSGMMAAPTGALKRWLVSALTNNNAQGEYYLTDIVAMAVAEGLPVLGIKAHLRPKCWASTTRAARSVGARLPGQQANALMRAGVRAWPTPPASTCAAP